MKLNYFSKKLQKNRRESKYLEHGNQLVLLPPTFDLRRERDGEVGAADEGLTEMENKACRSRSPRIEGVRGI